MAKWFINHSVKQRTSSDEQREELVTRLAAARAKLDDIAAAKKQCALAASGDDKAKRKFFELDAEAGAQRIECEMLALAVEAVEQQQIEEQRRLQEKRAAEGARRRKAILDAREAEAREDIERTIRRFESQRNYAQAEIWRAELSKVRERLEAEVS